MTKQNKINCDLPCTIIDVYYIYRFVNENSINVNKVYNVVRCNLFYPF